MPYRTRDRTDVRLRLDLNAAAILESLESDPDDVDGREALWMAHHRLLKQLEQP